MQSKSKSQGLLGNTRKTMHQLEKNPNDISSSCSCSLFAVGIYCKFNHLNDISAAHFSLIIISSSSILSQGQRPVKSASLSSFGVKFSKLTDIF